LINRTKLVPKLLRMSLNKGKGMPQLASPPCPENRGIQESSFPLQVTYRRFPGGGLCLFTKNFAPKRGLETRTPGASQAVFLRNA